MRFWRAVRSLDDFALLQTVSRKGRLDDRTMWFAELLSGFCDSLSSILSSDWTVPLKCAISIIASSLTDLRCSLKVSSSDSSAWARLVRSKRMSDSWGPASSAISSCAIS
jgi:hypothetical protein